MQFPRITINLPKMDIFIFFQFTLAFIFLGIFCYSEFQVLTDPKVAGVVKGTADKYEALFLAVLGIDYLKKRIQQADERRTNEPKSTEDTGKN